MAELFWQISGVFAWIVLISFFAPLILVGIIQFLLTCFAIIIHFIMFIVNPKYLIDFYTSTEDDDYE